MRNTDYLFSRNPHMAWISNSPQLVLLLCLCSAESGTMSEKHPCGSFWKCTDCQACTVTAPEGCILSQHAALVEVIVVAVVVVYYRLIFTFLLLFIRWSFTESDVLFCGNTQLHIHTPGSFRQGQTLQIHPAADRDLLMSNSLKTAEMKLQGFY